jgi:hypothetical protein
MAIDAIMENITIFTVKFNTYKIEIKKLYGEFCWVAYQKGLYDLDFKKIPCFTRGEEKHFPKRISKIAHAFWEEYTKHLCPDQ